MQSKRHSIRNALWTASLLTVLCTRVQATWTGEHEIWISTIGPAATNPSTVTGTPIDPFRCPTGTDLNTVLTNTLFSANTTFHFMAGTFTVSSNLIKVLPNWKIRGAGIDNTILQLQANSIAASSDLAVVSSLANENGVEISDLTVDCNLQNQSAASLAISAVALCGSDTRISRVKAINWGSTYATKENFVIFIGNQGGNTYTNRVIEDCIVTSPAQKTMSDGSSAISIFTQSETTAPDNSDAVMRNNLVYGVTSGTGTGQPNYFNAYGTGGNVTHNRAVNLTGPNSRALYRDTWNGNDIVIDGNIFDNVTYGIYFNMTGAKLNGVVIMNNVIRPSVLGFTYLSDIGDTINTNAYVSNLVMLNNVIYPATGATPVTAVDLAGQISATVMNNVFQGAGAAGCDLYVNWPLSPFNDTNNPVMLQFNTWANNVNESGTQLVETNDYTWQPGDSDQIKFTPTTNGWYRVSVCAFAAAATITVTSDLWSDGLTTDCTFSYSASLYHTDTNMIGQLQELNNLSYPYPSSHGHVTAARIVEAGSLGYPPLYLDIFVPSFTGPAKPIKVTATGKGYRGRLYVYPQIITGTPTYYKQFSL